MSYQHGWWFLSAKRTIFNTMATDGLAPRVARPLIGMISIENVITYHAVHKKFRSHPNLKTTHWVGDHKLTMTISDVIMMIADILVPLGPRTSATTMMARLWPNWIISSDIHITLQWFTIQQTIFNFNQTVAKLLVSYLFMGPPCHGHNTLWSSRILMAVILQYGLQTPPLTNITTSTVTADAQMPHTDPTKPSAATNLASTCTYQTQQISSEYHLVGSSHACIHK